MGPIDGVNNGFGVFIDAAPSPLITLASITDGTSNTMSFSEGTFTNGFYRELHGISEVLAAS